VESCCEFGIEPTGSMKCWETIEWLTSSGHSISVQLHIVSYLRTLISTSIYRSIKGAEMRQGNTLQY
jgi:hypothetical protein